MSKEAAHVGYVHFTALIGVRSAGMLFVLLSTLSFEGPKGTVVSKVLVGRFCVYGGLL